MDLDQNSNGPPNLTLLDFHFAPENGQTSESWGDKNAKQSLLSPFLDLLVVRVQSYILHPYLRITRNLVLWLSGLITVVLENPF